jgi:uncharacterized protein
VNVVVLADTHLRADVRRSLSVEAVRLIERADVVLHAGDVVTAEALHELRQLADMAPLHAVLGNNDRGLDGVLPETTLVELAGVPVAMVHDSGPRQGRARRLRHRFPTADLVVFGHSHVPCDEVGLEGQVLFNPGSPTQRRSQPHRTMGVLTLRAGRIVRRQVLPA